MKKFEKFKVNNQQSIVGGNLYLEKTHQKDGARDLWDSDKRRFIIFN